MSLPAHLFKFTLFDTVALGVAKTDSSAINCEEVISYAVQFVWDNGSGLAGNIYLEGSNNGVNFTQITDSILPISGTSGSHLINVEKPSYSFVRLSVDISAGSLTTGICQINAKRE